MSTTPTAIYITQIPIALAIAFAAIQCLRIAKSLNRMTKEMKRFNDNNKIDLKNKK